MNILVANNHLETTGGTENYTYAIIAELLKRGHHVEYFTFRKGEISDKIESIGVQFKSKKSYDLIIANHKTTIEALNMYGCIIQTCHGIFPLLEQPSTSADYHVSVTYEVQQHLKENNIGSTLINNGIDCARFYPKKEIHANLTSVLSLCQSEEANQFISECCAEIDVKFQKLNKHIDNLWDIEEIINDSDLVVGIGRSLYDAMACGRAVISYDNRNYSKNFGDGYLNSQNIKESLQYNCSGRGMQKIFTKESFVQELKKYNKADGDYFRTFALENLNVSLCADKYLNVVPASKRRWIRTKKMTTLLYQFIRRKIFSK